MKQGNQELLRPVYDRYQPGVLRIIRKFGVRNSMDIDDIVQESFISFFKVYELDWNETRAASTLYTITRNKCIDFYRKIQKEIPINPDQTETHKFHFLHVDYLERDPAEIIVENESYEELKNQLNEMGGNWSTTAILYFEEEKPIKEISAILGITEDACRSRIYRIRIFLKKLLKC